MRDIELGSVSEVLSDWCLYPQHVFLIKLFG